MARAKQKQKLFNGRDHPGCSSIAVSLKKPRTPTNSLLERVKFLAITGSNLDEYVEIRQAGLMQRIEDGYREPGYDGLRPDESLAALTPEIHTFVEAQYPAGTTAAPRNAQAGHPPARVGRTRRRRPRLRPELTFSAKSTRSSPPSPSTPPTLFRASSTKPSAWRCCSARKRRSSGPQVLGVVTVPARAAALRPPARHRWQVRLPPPPGPHRPEPRRHVPRL